MMSDLIKHLKEPDFYFPGNFDTVKRANAMLMCLCQEAADALEAKDAEIANLEQALALWKDDYNEMKELCDQMGEALERCTKYTDADYEALSAWKEMK